VEAEAKCDGAPRLHLKQSRYLPLGSTGDANERWQIPVCARYGVGKDAKESCTLLTDLEGDLPLGPTCPDWVMPNSDAAGYFRFALAPADLAKLQTKGFARLTPRERVAYADSLRGAYGRGTLSAKEIFPAAAVLATDSHPDIAAAPLAFLHDADEWLYGDARHRAVEGYTRTLYAPEYHQLGWAPAKDEDPDRTQLRVRVIGALASTAKDAAVRAEAKKRGLAFLGYGKDGKLHPEAVDPNLAAVALGVVGEEADAALWDSVKATLATAEDMTLRRRLLRLLTSSKKPELASRIRDLVFDPVLRPTETSLPLWSALSAPETREATWTWLKQNFDKVGAALPQHHGRTQIIAMANSFCDEAHAKDVEAFFTPARVAGIDGAPRVLASTLEEIRLCAARRGKQEGGVREFFGKR
jgi:alanyl aminopeptidase